MRVETAVTMLPVMTPGLLVVMIIFGFLVLMLVVVFVFGPGFLMRMVVVVFAFFVVMLIVVVIVFGLAVLMFVVVIAFSLLAMVVVMRFPQAAFSELQQLQTLYFRQSDDLRPFRQNFEGPLEARGEHLAHPENHARPLEYAGIGGFERKRMRRGDAFYQQMRFADSLHDA